MARSEKMAAVARQADPGFSFVPPQAHYDGVYFYAMARDPFARGVEHELIDRAAYRYGHVGYAWLAAIASFGRAAALPAALVALGIAGAGVAGYAASALAQELRLSGWLGLGVALSPGVIFAVTADTSEPVALAFAFLGLLLWARRRWVAASVFIAAACLTKEPLLVIPVGLAIWELVERYRGRGIERFYRRVALLSLGPVLFLTWYIYLRATFGVWPLQQEAQDFLTLPYYGWLQSMRQAAGMVLTRGFLSQIGSAAIALIAVGGAALGLGILGAARLRNHLDPVYILAAIVVLSLNPLGVLFPKDLIRESAFAAALLPFIVVAYLRGESPPEKVLDGASLEPGT